MRNEKRKQRKASKQQQMATTEHRQVTIAWASRQAEVDEEMAPLVLALWKAGINAVMSSYEHVPDMGRVPGIAWIAFATSRDTLKFLNLVAVSPGLTAVPAGESLFNHITDSESRGGWHYEVHAINRGENRIVFDGKVYRSHLHFDFLVRVWFPSTDVPLILERLETVTAAQLRQAVNDPEGEYCWVCGACPGNLHDHGCRLEQCSACGEQLLCCDCPPGSEKDRLPWTGRYPGEAECREFGWYHKLVPGVGWLPCHKSDPEAKVDLGRLYEDARWDPRAKRFVKLSI